MKTINKTSLLLAHIILAIAFQHINDCCPRLKYVTWHGLNPWNTVQAVPLMFKRFLKMDDWIIYSLSVLIIAYLWWRIYALVNKFRRS